MKAVSNSVSICLQSQRHPVSLPKVKQATLAILKSLKLKNAEIDLLLVSDAVIRSYNRRLLNHNWATDVISIGSIERGGRDGSRMFPMLRKKQIGSFRRNSILNNQWMRTVPECLQGNIIISLDTTARQAKEYGTDFFYELMFYICHGILHTLGWEDDTDAKRKKMWKKQERILKQIVKSEQ